MFDHPESRIMLIIRRRSVIVLLFLLCVGSAVATPCTHSNAWVERKVDRLILAAHAAYENEDSKRHYERVLAEISRAVRRCRQGKGRGFVSRYRNLAEYVEEVSLALKPDHELGFNVPDKQYFAETKQYLDIPDFLLDPKFLQDVSRKETLDRAKAYLAGLNSLRPLSDQLIFFSYTSQHLGTPDNIDSYQRLLIVVPGNPDLKIPDKWVQFGVTDPGKRVRIRNVSVVAALSIADGVYNTYFKDYFRTYRRSGSIDIKGRSEIGAGDDACIQCHKSGVLPIFPKRNSVSADEENALMAVNALFRSYGPPAFDKYLDASKFGPGLSSASVEDRNARFGTRFENTAVSHAMSCYRCHNSERFGPFNWPMDRTIISSFIKGGQMPRGYELNTAERAELYRKLIREYFDTSHERPGILKSWLLGRTQ